MCSFKHMMQFSFCFWSGYLHQPKKYYNDSLIPQILEGISDLKSMIMLTGHTKFSQFQQGFYEHIHVVVVIGHIFIILQCGYCLYVLISSSITYKKQGI